VSTELFDWFQRKFHFDFPVELHLNIRSRLRGAPARLEEETRGIDSAVLTRRPEEKWSIQENAGHLLDLEPLWLARVEDFVNGAATLSAADLTNRRTHEGHHNEARLGDILEQFRKARATLLTRLDRLSASDFARTARHPRLAQPMRLTDHLYFVAEHDDHHLARIRELRSMP
jgi:uncharacterized damage-inducible protein DinB